MVRPFHCIESSRLFLENEFYPEYGRNFEDKVLETIRMLHDQPDLGHEAFPELNRPDLRKLLCNGRVGAPRRPHPLQQARSESAPYQLPNCPVIDFQSLIWR